MLLLFTICAATSVAFAQRRVALVVGNGSYQSVPALTNPVEDATAVARSLRSVGFSVELITNTSRAGLQGRLQRFGQLADGAELALLYYAGHGIQVAGENYLIPIDARLRDARDVDFELVGLPAALRAMEGARSRVVILDACRDNPFAVQMRGLSGTRSVGAGLAAVANVDLGTLVAFSTSPGTVAADGGGRNSPFAAALLEQLRTPGLEVRQLMTRVRQRVVQMTGGRQVPWDNSSLLSDIFLAGAGTAGIASLPGPALAAEPPSASSEADPISAAARAEAMARGIPLPGAAELPDMVTRGGRSPLVGVWGDGRWGNGGRDALLVVLSVDESAGTADVINAFGPPTPTAWNQGPAGWFRIRNAALRNGEINFQQRNGQQFRFRLENADTLRAVTILPPQANRANPEVGTRLHRLS
ncbi:caspase family protein [Roseomonas sp. BN140053]|uniref:caspase family protein n=1 Tax=Roseomonas sp. BN140053 TaxID=3391898 RepID=UPI0039E7A411